MTGSNRRKEGIRRIRNSVLSGGAVLALALAWGLPAIAEQPGQIAVIPSREELWERVQNLEILTRQQQTLIDELRGQTEQNSAAVEEVRDSAGTVRSGRAGRMDLTISGQVNRGYLFVDDSNETEHFFVDNDASSTRFRLAAQGRLDEHFTAGAQIEVQIETNSSSVVSNDELGTATDDTGNVGFTQRKVEVWFEHDEIGRLWLGHGDTATNGIAEQDLSGTAVSALYANIGDQAGSMVFPLQGVEPSATATFLSGVEIGDVFSNLDGFSRRDRVRYDTPRFLGFQGRVSAAEGDRLDAAVFHAGEVGDFRTAAALGYAHRDGNQNRIAGSASVLHNPTGLNLTFATGTENLRGSASVRHNPMFYYIKPGWRFEAFDFGASAVALEYYHGEDFRINGSESHSWGAGFVQKIDDIATELFISARMYEYDEPLRGFDDIFALFTGARIKF